MSEDFQTIVARVAEGSRLEADIQALVSLIRAGEITLATGDGAVALGGSANDAVIVTGDNNQISILRGTDAEVLKAILRETLGSLQATPKLAEIPNNLPRSGIVKFVGRDQELAALHHQLQNEQATIAAIAGMGGVGKTELALQYAFKYKEQYRGGICWLQARSTDVGTQIIQFGRSRLQLVPPEDADLLTQVGFCWSHWIEGEVLVVFDDVVNYQTIKPYLPPNESRFKVLLTTRLRLGKSVKQLGIDVLDESAALLLLESFIGAERIQPELEDARKLCNWLGDLPLGIELVGRYLDRKLDLSLASMQQRLEKKRLEERALAKPDDDMTAHSGVNAAFELSWEILNPSAQELGLVLSLFALAPIPWKLVEQCLCDADSDELEELRDDFWLNLHLLQRKDTSLYQLHQLTREFLQAKQANTANSNQQRQQFCQAISAFAADIPEFPTLGQTITLAPSIPHIAEAATVLSSYLSNQDLTKPLIGLGRFYEGQSLYAEAVNWYEQCRIQTEQRFGQEHPDVATSIDLIASIYKIQGRYSEAEELYHQVLQMQQHLFGPTHLEVANTLNNLAMLYDEQKRLKEAESLFNQSLSIRQQLLGTNHPDVADSFNNLASVYATQERFEEAENLYQQAIELYQQTLGVDSRQVAASLHNLSLLYSKQQRYSEAALLSEQALALNKRLLGEDHLDLAANLNCLASIYTELERQLEAELLCEQALAIVEKSLGTNHPYVAFCLKTLMLAQFSQGRYEEAKPVALRGLNILEATFGAEHPDTIDFRSKMSSPFEGIDRFNPASY